MRRLIAMFLLPVFLFGALVPVQAQEELTKLSSLIGHFQEHETKSPELDFFTFLNLHYGGGYAKHRPDHDHSGLPMKTAHNHIHVSPPAVLPEVQLRVSIPVAAATSQPAFPDQSYTFILPHDIWQPPRSC